MDEQATSSAVAIGEQNADDVLARRRAARERRAAALAAHPRPIEMRTQVVSLGAAPVAASVLQTAGHVLALGDSWFDYPLHDVLKLLDDDYEYDVESAAHRGDPIEAMVSPVGQLDKFARCLEKLTARGLRPKAILISGGGDDIAGDEFGMLLNNAASSIAGWNASMLDGLIDQRLATAYRTMIGSINRVCQQELGAVFPVFVHGYDHPVPDGRGFLGGWGPLPGPWLQPGFHEKLFDDVAVNAGMMAALIDRFNGMLQALAAESGLGNVRYLDLRGTLSGEMPDAYKDDWGNELHPTGDGFSRVTAKFAAALLALP